MSGVFKSFYDGSVWLGKNVLPALASYGAGAYAAAGNAAAGLGTAAAGAASKSAFTPKPQPNVIPGQVQPDSALQGEQESDRIQRRRGLLSNIFAGNSSGAPNVGTKTLLGQ